VALVAQRNVWGMLRLKSELCKGLECTLMRQSTFVYTCTFVQVLLSICELSSFKFVWSSTTGTYHLCLRLFRAMG